MRIDDTSLGFELARVLATDSADRAHHVLGLLMNVTGAVAGLLSTPTSGAPGGGVLAVREYTEPLVEAITGDFLTEPVYQYLVADRARPLRSWREAEIDFAATPFARGLLIPAGYRGGVSMRISDDDGGYIGDLHLSTPSSEWPNDAGMVALERSRSILVGLCRSELGRAGWSSDRPALARIRVTRGPRTELLSVPGGTLIAGTEELAVRLSQIAGRRDLTCRWRAPDGRVLEVTAEFSSDGALVTVRDSPLPYGLTQREVDVLAYVWAGMSNYSISRRTGVRERTIAAHVGAILAKTGAASRARAAVVAEREGLVSASLLLAGEGL
ncbi:MAG: helix-turn-helix transcriptional regulator [Gordonia sp. (in: high G+C Gram-positive bacteria)]|uniref:helix-turn-helix transcriptional regulator n=1 Tax=Gordonia TaxID=2053 RepID=UPI0032638509